MTVTIYWRWAQSIIQIVPYIEVPYPYDRSGDLWRRVRQVKFALTGSDWKRHYSLVFAHLSRLFINSKVSIIGLLVLRKGRLILSL